jgi:glutaconate CoA-transferase, subunit A
MTKVAPLAEAMSVVRDGAHVAFTGFSITRNAVAAAAELARAGRRNLTLTQVIGGLETDLLVGSGCVSRLIYSGGSLDRFGPLHSVNRAISTGLRADEYSTLSLTLRLLAGSLGLPFVPARSLLGSQLLDGLILSGGARMISDPFTDSNVLALPPLRPDVAIVHADTCDEQGNASVAGPLWSLRETAFASVHVIVTAERLVPLGGIDPDRVTIPGTIVTAVAEVPGGARPTAVHGCYDYDGAQLAEHVVASRAGDEAFAAFAASRYLADPVVA